MPADFAACGAPGRSCHHGAVTSPPSVPGSGPASATDADRCPGMLRPHRAVDGALVRIRLIGGRLPAAALVAVGAAADRYGDGTVTLTSRGNLQLRGLTVDEHGDADPGLVSAIAAAGLLPSRSHERVRNVLASPLSGVAGGLVDVRPLAIRLDEIVCGTPVLADLSGRFLFGLDDGRGDLSDQMVDLGVTAVDRSTGRLRVASWWGPTIPLDSAVDVLVDLAGRFLSTAGSAWRVGDLPLTGRELLPAGTPLDEVRPVAPTRTLGRLGRDDGGSAFVVGAPLGRLSGDQVTTLARVAAQGGSDDVVITPDRCVVLPRVGPDAGSRLALAGLLTDPTDPRRSVTACTGAPGCGRAEAPTTGVAESAGLREAAATGLAVHVVACERRCGAPAGRHVELHVTRAGLHRHLRTTGARTR